MDSSAARPPKAGPIAHAGGHGDHRAVRQAADHAGQGPLHARDGDDHPGAHNLLQVGQQPVQPGHAHVVQPRDLGCPGPPR